MTREHHIKVAVLLNSLLLSPLDKEQYHEKRRQLSTFEGVRIGQLPRDVEFGFRTREPAV